MTEKTEEITQIWERQTGERSRQFELFTVYRDLGPSRSIEKVVQKCNADESDPGVSLSYLGKLSAKFGWVNRCEAWDDHLDKVARTEQELAIRDMRRRQARESAEFQNMAYGLKDEITGPEMEGKPTKKAWFLATVINAYGSAVMIEQDARGEPDDEDKEKKSGLKELARVFEESLPEDGERSEEGPKESK